MTFPCLSCLSPRVGLLKCPRGVALAATIAVFSYALPAFGQFRELIRRVPRSANALILLNMDKAKQSAMGQRENWNKKIEKAFEAGLIPVPPEAGRFVLASEMDLEFMEPHWSAAVVELSDDASLADIAERRGGTPDQLDQYRALVLPNDVYVVQFATQLLGAMAPANRQAVTRWLRQMQNAKAAELSPYLQKAAGFSDDAETEIIMAIDLDGEVSWQRIAKYLTRHKDLLQPAGVDEKTAAQALAAVEGLRLGIRIGDRPYGKLTLDFQSDVSPLTPVAKPLLLQILADAGMKIDDLEDWKLQMGPKTISLAGYLTTSGLRRVMSLVESPTTGEKAAKQASAKPNPRDAAAAKAQASLDHFRAITAMFNDLKNDMKSAKSIGSVGVWFDKYAKRINRLPTLNVDEDLLKYSGFVSAALREASGSVKKMGIQSHARKSQITSSAAGYGTVAYGYGRYGANGGYAESGYITTYDAKAEAKGIAAERLKVHSEEKGKMATDVQAIRSQVLGATADVRRQMTQRYKVEF